MTKILLIEVPDKFFKRKYFECTPEEIRGFLKNMKYFVDDTNTVYEVEDEVDIEETIRHHSGDCRLWLKDGGGYIDFFPKFVAMEVGFNELYVDIFHWMEVNTPSLYYKHLQKN